MVGLRGESCFVLRSYPQRLFPPHRFAWTVPQHEQSERFAYAVVFLHESCAVSPIRQLHQITSSWPKLVFAKTRTSMLVSMSTGMAQSAELHVDGHVLVALGQGDDEVEGGGGGSGVER